MEKVTLTATQRIGFQLVTAKVIQAQNDQRTFLAECLVEAGKNPNDRWAYNEADFSLYKVPTSEELKEAEIEKE
jgi:hypothetical protein